MVICDRLRELRESKNLSQGDIEKRTGLFRCYISRVENGHTVPAVETLEKFAQTTLFGPLCMLVSFHVCDERFFQFAVLHHL
jgi:transcriptional regulator with XRE-family HTH domain